MGTPKLSSLARDHVQKKPLHTTVGLTIGEESTKDTTALHLLGRGRGFNVTVQAPGGRAGDRNLCTTR